MPDLKKIEIQLLQDPFEFTEDDDIVHPAISLLGKTYTIVGPKLHSELVDTHATLLCYTNQSIK